MNTPGNFAELVYEFIGIINMIIPLIFAVTFLFVLWKVVDTWVIHGGEPSQIEEGKQVAFIGIIALVIMSSVWGIIALLRSSIF